MIDEIHGSGVGGTSGARPVQPKSDSLRSGSLEKPTSADESMLRNRLSGIAGDLEELLERLSSVQQRAGAGAEILERLPKVLQNPAEAEEIRQLANREDIPIPDVGRDSRSLEAVGSAVQRSLESSNVARGEIERSISSAQVALQNILAADTVDPTLPSGAPPSQGLDLDRQNVLQLLDHE